MELMRRSMSESPGLPVNPFLIGHLAEGEGFCDREREVERISTALLDASSRLVVYGDRRLGKSSALLAAANVARSRGQAVALVDLANATGAAAAAQRVLTAV